MKRIGLLLALLVACAAAGAADYGREKKWADEILPGLVVGDAVWLEAEGHQFLGLYAATANPRAAVLLVHGIGVHPDWGLIGTLRTGLADMGYATLSIQMPVLAADAKPEDYTPTMPESASRIAAAVKYLQEKVPQKPIAIVAHSLGARMVGEYLRREPQAPLAAYVAVGLSAPFPPLPSARPPIFDLYGSADLPQVLAAAKEREGSLGHRPLSRQARIDGADHFFTGKEQNLLRAVDMYLETVTAPR